MELEERRKLVKNTVEAMKAELTRCGLLPSLTPRMAHPKVMGWICGFVTEVLDGAEVPDKHRRSVRAEVYIGCFGEDMRGQMVAIDAVTEHEKITAGEARDGYDGPLKAAMPIGVSDGRAFLEGRTDDFSLKGLLDAT